MRADDTIRRDYSYNQPHELSHSPTEALPPGIAVVNSPEPAIHSLADRYQQGLWGARLPNVIEQRFDRRMPSHMSRGGRIHAED